MSAALAALLCALPFVGALCGVAALYFALGHRSLHQHARPVAAAPLSVRLGLPGVEAEWIRFDRALASALNSPLSLRERVRVRGS